MILHEPDGSKLRVGAAMQRKLKALGLDQTHADAVDFIINTLCGRHRASFLPGNSIETAAWLEGRRYVGEMLARVIERPIVEDPIPEEPPARTITEEVRRRNSAIT